MQRYESQLFLLSLLSDLSVFGEDRYQLLTVFIEQAFSGGSRTIQRLQNHLLQQAMRHLKRAETGEDDIPHDSINRVVETMINKRRSDYFIHASRQNPVHNDAYEEDLLGCLSFFVVESGDDREFLLRFLNSEIPEKVREKAVELSRAS